MKRPRQIFLIEPLLAQEARRAAQWQTLVRTDAQRTVRALTIIDLNDKTADGDTLGDVPHILVHLKNEAQTPKSEVWTTLVNAGVYDALCLCVLNGHVTALARDEKAKQHSPWFIPFQVICVALLCRGDTVTPTERRMVEDLRKHWSALMQQIWTQPMYCLGADQRGVVERAMLVQVPKRLAVLDPSFLGEFMKASDLTFAVCFRNWIHATARQDVQLSSSFLVAFLSKPHAPPHWTEYFELHPLPPVRALLPRILLGASTEAGPTPRKRTPQEVADTIVSSCIRHLQVPNVTLKEQWIELRILHSLLTPPKEEYLALPRAMFKFAGIWMEAVKVLRRAAEEGTVEAQDAYMDALKVFSETTGLVAKEGPEFANALATGWAASGLLKALDASVDYLVKIIGGPMTLTSILKILVDDLIPRVSFQTEHLIRAQFPCPHLASRLAVSDPGTRENQMAHHADCMSRIEGTGELDPGNPMWRQAAWEMLGKLTKAIRASGSGLSPCSRSGCGYCIDVWEKVTCRKCEAQFCSLWCLKSDEAHRRVCSGASDYDRNATSNPGLEKTMREIRTRQLVAHSILSVVLALVLWVSYIVLHGMWRMFAGLIWRIFRTPEQP